MSSRTIEKVHSVPSNHTCEFNFDGLVGPTHNYSGLSPGNLASISHQKQASNPRAAAHQGLAKMQRLRLLGVPQAILPPQPRPNIELLRRLGFSGDVPAVLAAAQRDAPHLLAAASSGSSMWTANAATVSPSADSRDGRVHFTAANLVTSLHRASEAETTSRILRAVFPDPHHFAHHDPLPSSADMGDEGAANHTRFGDFGQPGVQLFVYGTGKGPNPKQFPARQSLAASQAVARLHALDPKKVVFAKQNPDAIDAGVFHNDVIAVGHRRLLLCHELAFADPEHVLESLALASGDQIEILSLSSDELSLQDAVQTYLFNSQIVTTADDRTVLVAPQDCRLNPITSALIKRLVDGGTFSGVDFVDLGQSMNNGGGPACLRLRVILTPDQQSAISQGMILDDSLFGRLSAWIDKHYRQSLTPSELADPQLITESQDALDSLTELLGLGSIYDFQR